MTEYTKEVKIFKALSDENRLRIIEILGSGEMCACNLLVLMKIGQSTLSHHMKILCDADIVIGRKEGKWMYYSVNREGYKNLEKLLKQLGLK